MGIVPSIRRMRGLDRPFSPFHKGDGHVTDDTLMTRALVEVYAQKRDHLTAFDVAESLVPRLVGEKIWVPELGREDLLYHRLFLAEKWLVLKLKYGHADPREAGVGNIVNCGAAMYVAPVGLANAGDPDGAYAEALDLAGAHQSSYGREAAGVLAAAVADAARLGSSVDSVVETCLRLAHDGTHAALAAVVEEASRHTDWRDALTPLRSAFAPFDSVGPRYAEPSLGARTPSRLNSIEELPIALGLLVVTGGDFDGTVLGGVNYGRDADSIASMGGALAGALGGTGALRHDWVEAVSRASRLDVEEAGRTMAEVAIEIFDRDAARHRRREEAIGELTGDQVTA
jgi:ADP-ribosylglycohydrolase